MGDASGKSDSKLTVLVFRDNLKARTFQVPLSWLSRFGFSVGTLVVITLIASFLAIKYYRLSRNANPQRVHELELEMEELKAANAAAAIPSPATLPSLSPTPTAMAVNAPTPAVSPPQEELPPEQQTSSLHGLFPSSVKPAPPSKEALPIELTPAVFRWSGSGRTLKVQFNIQYVATDGKNQQGRIIAVARGPETLVGYPDDIFNTAPGSAALISPQKGEYFSVSRFRESEAAFELPSQNSVKTVEIYIFNNEGSLLLHQTVPVGPQKPTPARHVKPAEPQAPAKQKATGEVPSESGTTGGEVKAEPPSDPKAGKPESSESGSNGR